MEELFWCRKENEVEMMTSQNLAGNDSPCWMVENEVEMMTLQNLAGNHSGRRMVFAVVR